jgi:cytochrome P450
MCIRDRKRDTEVAGVPVKAGTMLMVRFAAANRDPTRYPDPDRFDVTRANAKSHLAFGRGIHMCVGNMLSRRELVVAFQELLDRVESFALAPGAVPVAKPNMFLRGLASLPVVLKRRQAVAA